MHPSVINTVETNPNPAATHTRESSGVSLNLNYVTSVIGVFKILEIILGLICWALIAAGVALRGTNPAFDFVLFVTITSWLTTVITFFVFLCGCHTSVCSGAPCQIIEFCHNLVWAIFYLCAACVVAANVFNVGQLIAGTVFAFFVWLLYLLHALFSFKDWRGDFPWN